VIFRSECGGPASGPPHRILLKRGLIRRGSGPSGRGDNPGYSPGYHGRSGPNDRVPATSGRHVGSLGPAPRHIPVARGPNSRFSKRADGRSSSSIRAPRRSHDAAPVPPHADAFHGRDKRPTAREGRRFRCGCGNRCCAYNAWSLCRQAGKRTPRAAIQRERGGSGGSPPRGVATTSVALSM
jgi:hypothetical protein